MLSLGQEGKEEAERHLWGFPREGGDHLLVFLFPLEHRVLVGTLGLPSLESLLFDFSSCDSSLKAKCFLMACAAKIGPCLPASLLQPGTEAAQ